MVANRSRKMDKTFYIYKKNCWTGQIETYTYVNSEEDAKSTVDELNRCAPFPYTYFYL